MKNYLIQIKTKGKEQIFLKEFEGKKMLKNFIEINYPRNKLSVFLIKEIILTQKKEVLKND